MFRRLAASVVMLSAVAILAVMPPRHTQGAEGRGVPLPHRWFRSGHDVADPVQRAELLRLIRTASEHGYNGMLLSTGTFEFRIKDPATVAGLGEVKAECGRRGIELIPCIPGVGWGGALWNEDPT